MYIFVLKIFPLYINMFQFILVYLNSKYFPLTHFCSNTKLFFCVLMIFSFMYIVNKLASLTQEVMDVEDLVLLGSKNRFMSSD